MPGKILGLNISDTYITSAEVLSGLKGFELLSCLSVPVEDNDIVSALGGLSPKLATGIDRCIVSIPLSVMSFRNIKIPFKDNKKIRKTLPFEMETQMPFPVDEMIFDYSIIDSIDGVNILTAGTYKKNIADYLEELISAGIDPDVIDICPVPTVAWIMEQQNYPDNGLYIEIEPVSQNAIVFQNRHIVLIREMNKSIGDSTENNNKWSMTLESICKETEVTIHSYNSQGNNPAVIEKIFFGGSASEHPDTGDFLCDFFNVTTEQIDVSKDTGLKTAPDILNAYDPLLMNNALAAALRQNKRGRGYNFRRGEFESKKRFFKLGPEFKISAILFAIFIFLLFFNTGVDLYNLNQKFKIVEQEYNSERLKKFPESKNYKYPQIQLKQKLEELEKSSVQLPGGINPDQKVLDILKDISQRIPESLDFDISTMSIDPETVQISGKTNNYSSADRIENLLETSNLYQSVKLGAVNLDKSGKRVNFELKLTRLK